MMRSALCILAGLLLSASALTAFADEPENHWTLLFYAGGDNSSEAQVMGEIENMKRSFVDGRGVELLVLIDRSPAFTADASVLGEDFNDTRLFRITHGKAERLAGGADFPALGLDGETELDTGDAINVARFIRFGKARYPAKRYGLIFFTHGNGAEWCPDDVGGTALFPAELTTVLEERDSLDLMGFDVCSMGGIENAYQWRPAEGLFGCQAMLASAPATMPWPYGEILPALFATPEQRARLLGVEGVPEVERSLAELTGMDLGNLMSRVVHKHRARMVRKGSGVHGGVDYAANESWACYDLTKVEEAKAILDELAVGLAQADAKDLAEAVRGEDGVPVTMNYFADPAEGWLNDPYFDIYDFAVRLSREPELPSDLADIARDLAQAVDDVVGYSFGMARYKNADGEAFEGGKHGLYLVFPDGDRAQGTGRHWQSFRWYHPFELENRNAFGSLAFCRDGAIPGNGEVENWFELLDSWFDDTTIPGGGLNGYDW